MATIEQLSKRIINQQAEINAKLDAILQRLESAERLLLAIGENLTKPAGEVKPAATNKKPAA